MQEKLPMTLERALELEKEAEANNGRCTHCEQTIKIYRYPISRTIKRVIKAIAKATTPDTGRAVDVDRDISIAHSERSQLSKMRQHGLIAQPKNDKGVKISRHWLITRKGWQFIAGEPVPAKVVVYNNQVLGHEGGTVVFARADAEADDFEQQPISEAESRTYSDVRTPRKQHKVTAVYIGSSIPFQGYQAGTAVELTLDTLQTGKPIKVLEPFKAEYKDIAQFGRYWRAV